MEHRFQNNQNDLCSILFFGEIRFIQPAIKEGGIVAYLRFSIYCYTMDIDMTIYITNECYSA